MKKFIALLLVMVMCVGAGIGGTLAYLTDRETETNVFTVGNVDIKLTEEFDQGAELLPGVEIEKDIKIKNVGENKAWVFYTYAVPEAIDKYVKAAFNTNTTAWAGVEDIDGTTTINGIAYKMHLVAYNEALASGEETPLSLTSLKLSEKIDAKDGEWVAVENGIMTATGWKADERPVVYVAAYAVQSDATIDSVEKAIAAYKGQWGGLNAEYDEVNPHAYITVLDEHDTLTDTDGNTILEEGLIIHANGGTNFGIPMAKVELDTAYQYEPLLSAEKGEIYEYADWHADFVVSADKNVPAYAIGLAGYYDLWCSAINDDKWVLLAVGDEIEAGDELRLVDGMGGGSITVAYKDLCTYGNDGIGFLCGAVDLSGKAINDSTTAGYVTPGTTLTVELRLYEATDSTKASETGKYIVVDTKTYTFEGEVEVSTADELQAAINNGCNVILVDDIDLGSTIVTVPGGVTATLDLNGHVISGVCNAANGTAFTVNNGATLNIKDSGIGGKISYAAGSANQGYAIKLVGNLNLYSGTIELTGNWTDGICYAVDIAPNVWSGTATDSVFNMYGGKVVSSKDAIRVANYSATSYNTMKVGFNMEGGEVIAARDGIFMQQHNENQFDLFVTVTGGTIKADVRPIRVYGPIATDTLSGNAKSMTITAKSGALVLNGTVDTSMTWHTEGKIAVGGGMTVENLNNFANITLN